MWKVINTWIAVSYIARIVFDPGQRVKEGFHLPGHHVRIMDIGALGGLYPDHELWFLRFWEETDAYIPEQDHGSYQDGKCQ